MTPPIRWIFERKMLLQTARIAQKNEHLIIVQVVGGVMTPPYNKRSDKLKFEVLQAVTNRAGPMA